MAIRYVMIEFDTVDDLIKYHKSIQYEHSAIVHLEAPKPPTTITISEETFKEKTPPPFFGGKTEDEIDPLEMHHTQWTEIEDNKLIQMHLEKGAGRKKLPPGSAAEFARILKRTPASVTAHMFQDKFKEKLAAAIKSANFANIKEEYLQMETISKEYEKLFTDVVRSVIANSSTIQFLNEGYAIGIVKKNHWEEFIEEFMSKKTEIANFFMAKDKFHLVKNRTSTETATIKYGQQK